VNPRKRNILKLKARQAKVVTPVAPVVPAKRKIKKSTPVPETVTEKKVTPEVTEKPKATPNKTKRKRTWKA